MQAEAIDAVFEELGETATYMPSDEAPQIITIRRATIETSWDVGFSNGPGVALNPAQQLGAFTALVRVSEVETPAEGDALETSDGRRYRVQDPKHNGFGVWRLPLVEITE